MSLKATPPAWLLRPFESRTHLKLVLESLQQRESARNRARSTSRKANRDDEAHLQGKHKSPEVVYYSVAIGDRHQAHNRYIQIEPYDRNRVVVAPSITGGLGSYLNASWVLEKFGQKWWIATQAPLPQTAHTFLSLIRQPTVRPPRLGPLPFPTSRVRTVVQLTQNVESGRVKAHEYFPEKVGRTTLIEPDRSQGPVAPLKVTLLSRQYIETAHCFWSTVSVVPDSPHPITEQDLVIFHHLLYTSWPDHGVPEPEDRQTLLAFVDLVEKINRDRSLLSHVDPQSLDPDPPIVVGCSAGIGRTGSFITISSLLRSLSFLPPPVSPTPATYLEPSPFGPLPDGARGDLVAEEIDSLRDQRPGMVQRTEQVLLIYQALQDKYN
ncbi:phosphatases II [Pluteus cervinus]|uniref:Phosphatases II n=1 Tax=Pluteus cervinus TaxID=181527 RepID=A0ACD3ARK7_9AGAR|nr:phosphatases II [Pluteus cervinus]